MKKIIAVTMFLFLLGASIPLVHAQTVTSTKTTINDAQLEQVLTLLLTELSFLEQEYNQLQSEQASTTVELGQIGTATSTTSSTLPELTTIVPLVTQTTTVTRNQTSTPPTQPTSTQPTTSAPAPIPNPTITVTQDLSVPIENVQAGGIYKQPIAQFILSATSTIVASKFSLEISSTTDINSMTNLTIVQNGVQFGQAYANFSSGIYNFSSYAFAVTEEQPVIVTIYANVSSSIQEIGDIGPLVTLNVFGAQESSTPVAGQDVIIATSTTN